MANRYGVYQRKAGKADRKRPAEERITYVKEMKAIFLSSSCVAETHREWEGV